MSRKPLSGRRFLAYNFAFWVGVQVVAWAIPWVNYSDFDLVSGMFLGVTVCHLYHSDHHRPRRTRQALEASE